MANLLKFASLAAHRRGTGLLMIIVGLVSTATARAADGPATTPVREQSALDPYQVKSVTRLPDGLRIPSPDGKHYLASIKDAQGVYQVYVGKTGSSDKPVCISNTQQPGGPKVDRNKMQINWHPSGKWIIMAAEWDEPDKPWFAKRDFKLANKLAEGLLQCGIWTNIYATTPDGSKWFKLSDFGPSPKPGGFTGVAFTPDGKKGAWTQIIESDMGKYTFGDWQLILADFRVDHNGVPSFTNPKNISPPGSHWLEPGNFSPDGRSLLLSADIGFPDHAHVEGQDQFILDITTGKTTNLTNSPGIWDEHGVFSPDGKKILFMSSYPFRDDPKANKTLGLKTEFMMINGDGTGLRQLTHFNEPGYPESHKTGAVAAVGGFSADGRSIECLVLLFPEYETWKIEFEGPCGRTGKFAPPVAQPALAAGNHVRHVQHDKLDRTYLMHIPPQYDGKKPMPVVLVYHGALTNGEIAEKFTGLSEKADKEGFIAVYPDGTGVLGMLTLDAGTCCGSASQNKVDDVGFTRDLLDDLESVAKVDTKRVFATGISNGGMMCYRLASELSDRIAAVAPVAGTMGLDTCNPKRPVSIMAFHGTNDKFVPFNGGVGAGKVVFNSVDYSIKAWVKADGCSQKPVITDLPKSTDDGTTIKRQTYAGGKEGTEVVLYVITGGGHTWPGRDTVDFLGKSTHNISANDLMWEFFKRHPMK